jgi:hypothetical protein
MKFHLLPLSLCLALAACSNEKPSDLTPLPSTSLLSEVPTATNAPSLLALSVPSDPNAQIYVLEKGEQGNERTIVTKRVGSSGTSYSKRLYNCQDNTVKYLGSGNSVEAMARSPADAAMGPVQEGSIAYYVGLQACQ